MASLNRQPYSNPDSTLGVTLLYATWERWGNDIEPGLWACILPCVRFARVAHCVVDDYGSLREVPAEVRA